MFIVKKILQGKLFKNKNYHYMYDNYSKENTCLYNCSYISLIMLTLLTTRTKQYSSNERNRVLRK